jgi:hypothetical protein
MEENNMKKILSLGVATAVLSLTAVAASAALAPVVNDDAVSGETLVVDIVADAFDGTAIQGAISASDNLTLVDSNKGSGTEFNADNMRFAWAASEAPADGTVLLTLTFTVDAAADEEVSVAIVPDAGFESGVDADAVVLTVVDAADDDLGDEDEPGDDEGDEEEEEPGDDEGDEGDDEGDDGLVDDGNTDADAASDEEENVPTGVGLAVVPVLVAGAAVVVAKKRK